MKKRLTLPLRLHLNRHSGQTVLNIELGTDALANWCLGLCLLKEGLVSMLLVCEEDAKGVLEIELAGEVVHRTKSQARFYSSATRVRMTPNDLDYLLHFCLKYFRDGAAEVDHIDIDVVSQTDSQESTITFKVPDSIRPLSAEEARKRLELE